MVLPEIVAAGIYDSRRFAKGVALSKKRKTSLVEIEIPLDFGGIAYLDGQAVPITPDLIFCAKPGQLRYTKFPYRCCYVHLIVQEGLLYDTLMRLPTVFHSPAAGECRALLERLMVHYNALTEEDEIRLQSLLLELIYRIRLSAAEQGEEGAAGAGNQHLIRQAVSFIKENLTEPLPLERVAAAVHLSPVHFHNAFRSGTGKTLRDYVEEQRIKKAINLLLTTDFTLTQIAFECGFSSQSYFSYVFRRRMNKTPREYAKSLGQQG